MLFFPQKCQNNRSSLNRSDWMQANSWVVSNKTTGCIFQSKFDLGRAGKCCTKIYLRNSTYIKNYFAFFHIQISEVSSRSTYTTKIIYCNSIYRQLPEYLNNRSFVSLSNKISFSWLPVKISTITPWNAHVKPSMTSIRTYWNSQIEKKSTLK